MKEALDKHSPMRAAASFLGAHIFGGFRRVKMTPSPENVAELMKVYAFAESVREGFGSAIFNGALNHWAAEAGAELGRETTASTPGGASEPGRTSEPKISPERIK